MGNTKKEGWINIYLLDFNNEECTGQTIHESEEMALKVGKELDAENVGRKWIATIKIEY